MPTFAVETAERGGVTTPVEWDVPERMQNRPVVGVVVHDHDFASAATIVRRANREGLFVLLIRSGIAQRTLEGFEEYGTGEFAVVHPLPPSDEQAVLRHTLRVAARSAGFPGLIECGSTRGTVDFDASLSHIRDSRAYAMDAITQDDESAPTGPPLVVIPAYNEASTIGDVVTRAGEYADEVLVVDDGSEDETVTRAREAGATVICHEENRGYGASLKTGFEESLVRNASTVVTLDADSQHDPAEVPGLLDAHRDSGADVVIGSRFASGAENNMPPLRGVGLLAINVLTNLGNGAVRPSNWVKDTQSGFRLYSADVVRTIVRDGTIDDRMGASTDLIFLLSAHDYVIQEVGATFEYEVDNPNTHGAFAHGFQLVRNALSSLQREYPLHTLGVPGLTLWFAGIAIGFWTLHMAAQTAAFPFWQSILSGLFIVIGVLASFTAILDHTIERRL